MLKSVLSAQLNLQSKYTLEKLKLKKVLQILHAEINQSGLRLQLRGGLETMNDLVEEGSETNVSPFGGHNAGMDPRSSVSMN